MEDLITMIDEFGENNITGKLIIKFKKGFCFKVTSVQHLEMDEVRTPITKGLHLCTDEGESDEPGE